MNSVDQDQSEQSFYANKKILITGASGYLATNLTDKLKHINCTIVRLTRQESLKELEGVATILDVCADVTQKNTWQAVLENVDIIFYFAGQTSVYIAEKNVWADLISNVSPIIHLCEQCQENNSNPIVVFAGTATETGLTNSTYPRRRLLDDPITIYDIHKLSAEKYLKYYSRNGVLRATTLRLANVYGPGPKSSSSDRGIVNMMIRKALNNEPLTIYGDGKYTRDYVYIDDVINAFLMVPLQIEKTNGWHFEIGSGIPNTIMEVINMIASLVKNKTDQDVFIKHIDEPANLSQIESRNFVANIDGFMKLTGWRPNLSLEEGISQTINYLIK
jgi:UDP-glucose 4-epimerase